MDDGFLEQELDTDVDLTPLIDVIFMLLLFFILASTFSQPALRVALPSASTASPVASDSPRLVFSIDAAGVLHNLGRALAPDEISGVLAANPDRSVDLRVDRAAPFQPFITALDRIRQAGRDDVFITAQPEQP